MPPRVSPDAVALRVPPILWPTAGRAPAPAIAVTPSADGAVQVVRTKPEHGLRFLVSALGDIVGLLAVAYAFPLVILAVGIPIALLIRLVMWLAGQV